MEDTDEQIRALNAKVDDVLTAVTAMQAELKSVLSSRSELTSVVRIQPSSSNNSTSELSRIWKDDSANRTAVDFALTFDKVSAELSRIWKEQATVPLATLQKQMWIVLRNHDFDPSGPTVSDLMAVLANANGVYGFTVTDTMHVILGVVSDSDVNVRLTVGGNEIGMPLSLRANVPHPILVDDAGRAWPLVAPYFHEIRLDNPSRVPSVIHALGVRLKKSECHALADTFVPGICRIHQGICDKENLVPGNHSKAGEWSPLNAPFTADATHGHP